jgi:type VI secretion system secreted protein VgrG
VSDQALEYWLELPNDRYAVRVVRGEEALSRPFSFDLTFTVEQTDGLDPAAVIRQEAALVLLRRGEERRITGIVTSITRKATRMTGASGGGEIHVVLEPKLVLLRHRVDIRVFRDKTAPQIVMDVMHGLGVDVQSRLRGKYKVRPYCVEFRESDLDFVHRLMEDEGIFYFVDEAGAVVLGDAPQAYDDSVGMLPYKHGAGLDTNLDAISEIGSAGEMTAGRVSLRDWNHEHPRMNMDVTAVGPTLDGAEWYDYPGEYEEPPEGQAKANLRAEALRCLHHRTAGRSFCAGLRPGVLFQVMGTPAGATDGGYAVTRVVHAWTRDEEGFELAFEALPEDVAYRPPVVTHVPVQTNPLTGFVTGPAGADIHTDAWGRVKVHFPWDRLQPKDDNCSHWIPVLQDNTGHSSAMSRTRWEVLCHFLEGDPDRPVVLGRVYNADDQFYSPLPERKMRIALRSLVSPRSEDGLTPANYIQFDDYAGAEGIAVHAQKDQNVVVLNDKREQIDSTETVQIKGNETIKIGANQTIQTKLHMQPDVDGNMARTIGGQHSIGTGSSLTETVDGNHTLTIGGSHKRQMGTSDTMLVEKNLTESVGGVILEASVKTNSVMGEKTSTLLAGGAVLEVSKGNKTDMTGLGKIETIGGLVFKQAGKFMATRTEKLRNTTVGAFFRVDAMKELLVAGIEMLTKKTLSASYEGTQKLTLRVGGTEINMQEGRIEMNAVETIEITTKAENKQASETSTQI